MASARGNCDDEAIDDGDGRLSGKERSRVAVVSDAHHSDVEGRYSIGVRRHALTEQGFIVACGNVEVGPFSTHAVHTFRRNRCGFEQCRLRPSVVAALVGRRDGALVDPEDAHATPVEPRLVRQQGIGLSRRVTAREGQGRATRLGDGVAKGIRDVLRGDPRDSSRVAGIDELPFVGFGRHLLATVSRRPRRPPGPCAT